MKLDDLKKLIKLLESSNLEEIEIEEEGQRIRIKKPTAASMTPMAPIIKTSSRPESVPRSQQEDNRNKTITSPFVGTFYRASAPDAPPFIDEGDTVAEGDVLCIIEAMKLMNEIESDISGTISQILVKNGDPVEFGQPLFRIEAES